MKKLLSIVLPFVLMSCSLVIDKGLNFDSETFEAEKAAWEAAQVQNYQFTHDRFINAGPQPKIIVTVEGGEYLSSEIDPREYEDGTWSDEYGTIEYMVVYRSIDEVYSDIAEIVENCQDEIDDDFMRSADITIRYDEENHIPVYINGSASYYGDVVGGFVITVNISDYQITE